VQRTDWYLLDYDGTLVHHTPLPETAILPENMSDIIIKLVDNPQTKIFIITGRAEEILINF